MVDLGKFKKNGSVYGGSGDPEGRQYGLSDAGRLKPRATQLHPIIHHVESRNNLQNHLNSSQNLSDMPQIPSKF